MSSLHKTVLFLLLSLFSVTAVAEPNRVVTISPLFDKDTRYAYTNALLKLILEKTQDQYGEDVIERYTESVPRERSLQLIQEGKIHVFGKVTESEWERTLIPIRIPIRKGLLGYRLFLTNAQNYDALNEVESLEALKKLSTGGGSQWVITDILRKNGFNVVTSNQYPNLFKMLNADRFSTFSRGINEIYPEFELHSQENTNIQINQTIALYSPLPSFFFVSPKYELLAKRIKTGLEMMISSGEFDEFFYRYYADAIRQSRLGERKVFAINNHKLSPETRAIYDTSRYWLSPFNILSNIVY